MTIATPPPEAPPETRAMPPRSPWVLVVSVTVAALVGVVFGAAISMLGSNDNSTPMGNGTTGSGAYTACQSWAADNADQEIDPDLCRSMAAWMADRAWSGPGTMMGRWGDLDEFRDSCIQWSEQRRGDDFDAARCDSMVSWMRDHRVDPWGQWMMRDR